MKLSRRTLLAAGAAGAAGLGYVLHRGVRFPRLTLAPTQPAIRVQESSANLTLDGAIRVIGPPDKERSSDSVPLRAFTPEPLVAGRLKTPTLALTVHNVMPQASLVFEGEPHIQLDESVTGCERTIRVIGKTGDQFKLRYEIDHQRAYRVAIIGDSGGGDELVWCLERAAQLSADFLLHLGDFNYARDEYEGAINAFRAAQVPTYITLGNHDFNDAGLVYPRFINELGPFNHAFAVAGTDFINVDTAASFLPLKRGHRGTFLTKLRASSAPKIVFSHRPFVDIRPGEDHNLSSDAEARWLLDEFARIGAGTYLNGHVHKSGATAVEHLQQWTVGEGLGYEDWVARKQVSQLLVGTIAPGEEPHFEWADLAMPWASHTSHEHLQKLLKEQPQTAVDWYRAKVVSLRESS